MANIPSRTPKYNGNRVGPRLINDLAQQKRVTGLASSEPTLWVTAERLPLFRALFHRQQTAHP